jgi:hypothetical protein
MSASQLLDWVKELQVKFLDIKKAYVKEVWPDESEYRKHYFAVEKIIFDANRSGQRHGLDFKAELVFFPHPEYILVLTFWDRKDYDKVWKKHPGVAEWGYWDNTDWPDGMTKKEWDKRCKDWEMVLGGDGYGKPSECGFTITVADEKLPWPKGFLGNE